MRVYQFLIFGAVVCCGVVRGTTHRNNDADSLDLITHIRRVLPDGGTKPVYLLSIERLPSSSHQSQHAKQKQASREPAIQGKSNIMSPPERHEPPSNEKDPPETSTPRALLNKDRLIAKKIKFALYRKSQPFLRYRPEKPSEAHESFQITPSTEKPNQESHQFIEHNKVNISLSLNKKHNENKDRVPLKTNSLSPIVGGDHIGNRYSLPTRESWQPPQLIQSWSQNRRHHSTESHYSRPHTNQNRHHSSHRHHHNSKHKHRKPENVEDPHHMDTEDHQWDSFAQQQEHPDEEGNINYSNAEHHYKPQTHGSHHSLSSSATSHKHRPVDDQYENGDYNVDGNSSKQSFDNEAGNDEGETTEEPNRDALNPADLHDDRPSADHDGTHQQHDPLSSNRVKLDQHHRDDYKAGSGMDDDDREQQHLPADDDKQEHNTEDPLDGSQETNWDSLHVHQSITDQDNEEEDQPEQHESTNQSMEQSDKDKVGNGDAENYGADEEANQQYAAVDAASYSEPEANAQESEMLHQQPEDYRPNESDGQPAVSGHPGDNMNLPDEETYDPVDNEEDTDGMYPEDQLYSNENNYSQNIGDWDPYDEEDVYDQAEGDYTPSYSHADGYYPEEYDEDDYYNNYPSSKPSQAHNALGMAVHTTERPYTIETEDQSHQETATSRPSPQQPDSNEDNTSSNTPSSNNQAPNNQDSNEVAPASNNIEAPVAPNSPEPQEIDPDVAPISEQVVAQTERPQRPPEPNVQRPTVPAYRPPPARPTYIPPEDYIEEEEEEDVEDLDDYYEEIDTAPSLYGYYNSYPSTSQENLSTPSYNEGYETGYEASSPSAYDYPSSPPSYEERRVGESKRKLRSKLRKRRSRSLLRSARKLV